MNNSNKTCIETRTVNIANIKPVAKERNKDENIQYI